MQGSEPTPELSGPTVLRLKRRRGEAAPRTLIVRTDEHGEPSQLASWSGGDPGASKRSRHGPTAGESGDALGEEDGPHYIFERIGSVRSLGHEAEEAKVIEKKIRQKLRKHIAKTRALLRRGAGAAAAATAASSLSTAPSAASPAAARLRSDVAIRSAARDTAKRRARLHTRRQSSSGPLRMLDVPRLASSFPDSPTNLGIRRECTPFIPNPACILTPIERVMDEAVWFAATSGEFSKVWEALSKGAPVDYQRKASDGSTALMAAAACGRADIVLSLLRRGAVVDLMDSEGRTALDHAAVEAGNPAIHPLTEAMASAGHDTPDEIVDVFVIKALRNTRPCATHNALITPGVPAPPMDAPTSPLVTNIAPAAGPASQLQVRAAGRTASGAAAMPSHGSLAGPTAFMPGIRLSAADQAMLRAMYDSGFDGDAELAACMTSDDEDAGTQEWDTEDSNAEDAAGNEYPDEPSSGISDEDGSYATNRAPMAASAAIAASGDDGWYSWAAGPEEEDDAGMADEAELSQVPQWHTDSDDADLDDWEGAV